ncbi:UNVERIFIED_CONTAM: hypothetical protein Sangu_0276500 [Sesamum angustifolium]|uniref:Uncharacterized protein n=1 Tax=Sesamum angustifolium TaxID=2727405 RepID=A0AAW2QP38_9LAMI
MSGRGGGGGGRGRGARKRTVPVAFWWPWPTTVTRWWYRPWSGTWYQCSAGFVVVCVGSAFRAVYSTGCRCPWLCYGAAPDASGFVVDSGSSASASDSSGGGGGSARGTAAVAAFLFEGVEASIQTWFWHCRTQSHCQGQPLFGDSG